jgi:hypothetical protein
MGGKHGARETSRSRRAQRQPRNRDGGKTREDRRGRTNAAGPTRQDQRGRPTREDRRQLRRHRGAQRGERASTSRDVLREVAASDPTRPSGCARAFGHREQAVSLPADREEPRARWRDGRCALVRRPCARISARISAWISSIPCAPRAITEANEVVRRGVRIDKGRRNACSAGDQVAAAVVQHVEDGPSRLERSSEHASVVAVREDPSATLQGAVEAPREADTQALDRARQA